MLPQTIFTEEELRQLCKEWQEILRLQDWDVSLSIKRKNEMKFEDVNPLGEVQWCISMHTATVKILDQIDHKSDFDLKRDMETDLVHELLHLHTCLYDNFEKDSMEKLMMERSINCIAEALVKLKRRDNPQIKNFAIKGVGLT